MNLARRKQQVSQYALMLHERGWVANHDGNVSARTQDGKGFVITPTGISKRVCHPDTIVACNAHGQPLGRGRPPSEVQLHVGAYRSREDVTAVIHAHPPYASAFALARRPLTSISMPEVVVSLGPHIPVAPMVLPKATEAADVAASAVSASDVVLLAGNGVLAVGPDLETAFLRTELIEHYAKIVAIMEGGVGAPVALSSDQLDHLMGLRKKAGLHREGAAVSEASPLRAVVEQEVRRILGEQS